MATTITMPGQLNTLVGERAKVWEELDSANAKLSQMQKVNAQIPANTPVALLPPAAHDLSPLDEITQLAHQMNSELATVARIDAEIASTEAAIKEKEAAAKQAKNIQIALILLAVLIVLCLLASIRR